MPFDALPWPQGGQFCEKRSAMAEEAFVARTQIVQPCFAIGCPENAILWAPTVAEREDLACQAITG